MEKSFLFYLRTNERTSRALVPHRRREAAAAAPLGGASAWFRSHHHHHCIEFEWPQKVQLHTKQVRRKERGGGGGRHPGRLHAPQGRANRASAASMQAGRKAGDRQSTVTEPRPLHCYSLACADVCHFTGFVYD